MKNRRQKYLWVKLYLVACFVIGFSLSACRSPEPAKPLPPVMLVSGDNQLVVPAGSVLSLEDGRSFTTRVDFLMLSRDAVSNLQARGYLP